MRLVEGKEWDLFVLSSSRISGGEGIGSSVLSSSGIGGGEGTRPFVLTFGATGGGEGIGPFVLSSGVIGALEVLACPLLSSGLDGFLGDIAGEPVGSGGGCMLALSLEGFLRWLILFAKSATLFRYLFRCINLDANSAPHFAIIAFPCSFIECASSSNSFSNKESFYANRTWYCSGRDCNKIIYTM